MTPALTIGFFLVLLLFSFLLNVVLLRLSALVFRIPGLTWRRAALITILLSIVSGVAWRAGFWIRSLKSPWSPLVTATVLGGLIAILGLLVLCLHRAYRAPARKAVPAGLAFIVLSYAIGTAAGLAARTHVMESFQQASSASAPSVLGLHLDAVCSSCEIRFPLGISSKPESWRPDHVDCFNCGARIDLRSLPAAGGDCLLSEKVFAPRRWNLVAFRGGTLGETYLQRLVGLPGETLEVVDGDLFADGRRLVRPPGTFEGMWIPVRDSGPCRGDKAPRGWKATGTLEASPGSPDGFLLQPGVSLELEPPPDDSFPLAILGGAKDWPRVPVHDVRVDLGLGLIQETAGGDGPVVITWEHAGRKVEAQVGRHGEGKIETAGGSAAGELRLGGGEVSFQVRDGVAALLRAGKVVASLQISPQEIANARALPAGAPCRLSLGSRGCAARIERIAVFRDVHYIAEPGSWPVRLGADAYFILSDKVKASFDSRVWGPSPRSAIVGVAHCLWWPLGRMRSLD